VVVGEFVKMKDVVVVVVVVVSYFAVV